MPVSKVGGTRRPKTGGRKAGTPNKTTGLLKDALLQAAEAAGDKEGMVGYLTKQAKENPNSFLPLLGRVLPLQVAGSLGVVMTTKEQRDAAVDAASRANG